MSSIFELLNGQLSGGAIDQISRQLGADRGAVEKAVPAALATLMGGLARNTQSSSGAAALASALGRDHDGSNLGDLVGMLSAFQSGPGEGILRHILGAKRPAVETGLSRSTGLDAGSMGKLLTMLAPLVLGALGKTQRQKNLDPGGLASILAGERQNIEKMAPQGGGALASMLDADGDGQIADDVAKLGAGLLKGFLKRR